MPSIAELMSMTRKDMREYFQKHAEIMTVDNTNAQRRNQVSDEASIPTNTRFLFDPT